MNPMSILNGLLYTATFAVACDFYDKTYANVATLPQFAFPEWLYWVLLAAMIGVSVLVTLFHVVGGGLFGATAGGVLTGMKHGLILGAVQAFGRLWPYAVAIALASFFFNATAKWHTIAFLVLAAATFSVKYLADLVWKKVNKEG